MCCAFFFCRQKTAYEMRISDWSSDVCSSDLLASRFRRLSVGPIRAGSSSSWPTSPRTPGEADRRRRTRRSRRSEERRVGEEGGRTCRTRGQPYNYKKKNNEQHNRMLKQTY